MKQHRFDPLSFVFGILFLTMASAAVWNDRIDWDLGVWLLPAAALFLGIGIVASSLRGSSDNDT
jgi:hypothetical protein